MQDKTPGIRIDDFFVTFPEKDFIKEDKDGKMYLVVDIFKLSSNNELSKVKESEVTEEIETKISAYVNEILLQAIEEEENKHK